MFCSKFEKLSLLLAGLVFLNLFDLLSTLAWCQTYGFEQELNPLMRYLFVLNPVSGVSFKIASMVLFVVTMRYASRQHFQLVYLGTIFVVIIYSALFCWHLIGPVLAAFEQSSVNT